MAKLFDSEHRIVPTWLAAARFLNAQPKRKAINLVLEIIDPRNIRADERALMAQVDAALESRDNWPLSSVAGTIFPQDLYVRYGRPAFYDRYKEMLVRGKARGTWGTYAHRMISRQGRTTKEVINPLELLVSRIRDAAQPNGKSFTNSYELGLAVPEDDLSEGLEVCGAELPTYNVATDGKEWYGYPCLSHVSVKRVARPGGHVIDLTGVYRSHRYCERALGNLLGLANLQSFIAKEAGLSVGTLTCISTAAELDINEWGGRAVANAILAVPLNQNSDD